MGKILVVSFVATLIAVPVTYWVIMRHDQENPAAKAAAVEALESQGVSIDQAALLWVVDFSKPSYAKRSVIYDLKSGSKRLARVTHGKGSSQGTEPFATTFSNEEGSHQSSLGLFRIGTVEASRDHGSKILLHGLEQGLNSRAASRAIVIHPPQPGSNYLSLQAMLIHLLKDGWLGIGRSQGCPVLAPEDYAYLKALREKTSSGAYLYIYHPDF